MKIIYITKIIEKKKFNDDIFLEMLELELYLKKKYPKINYNILYFNFIEHNIPEESNIINITINTNKLYCKHNSSPFDKFRKYCGKILCDIFKSKYNPSFNTKLFYKN